MTVKVKIENPKSAYYTGPKSDAPYMLYVEARDKGFYVEFDTENNFPDALVKAGVNLSKEINPDMKTMHLAKSKPDRN